ncbi:MAG: polysaccharide deacetylase family protein [Flavobacteriaceae bacterium]|nr:polysaccharide deacetylase family protein [Flavobacteriaceae bacterium]
MLLVYTYKITPRLTYIFKHIFTRILHIELNITTKIEEFIAHEGLKFSYTKQALGNEIFVKSSDLLFNQGIDYLDINITNWDDVPCFFQTGSENNIPCDFFAASFYLISRYEEYLPHVKDEFERFPAAESLAFQHKFLDKPVIDIWVYKFKEILLEKFPDQINEIVKGERRFNYISTIDVDIAFSYKHKGFIRTVGGALNDLVNLKIQNILYRFLVIFNIKKDPFDTFDELISLQKKYNINTLFFFLLSEYTTYDKNISSGNINYKLLIKNIADYTDVGIHPSYFSMKKDLKIKKEKMRLEEIVNFPIEKSRQHYLRMELPETYQYLVDLEIKEDYTMGYASHYGFRAGTCTPFYFYDLDFEIQTPLKIFPFAAMDGTLKDYLNFTPKKSFNVIMELAKEVKKVDGTLITLFHNESVSGYGQWRGWNKLYERMLQELSTDS